MLAVQFLQTFLQTSTSDRAQLITRVSKLNDDPQITNLLQNIDINYRKNRDVKIEAAERRKPSNIYFVVQMLAAFPNFKM